MCCSRCDGFHSTMTKFGSCLMGRQYIDGEDISPGAPQDPRALLWGKRVGEHPVAVVVQAVEHKR